MTHPRKINFGVCHVLYQCRLGFRFFIQEFGARLLKVLRRDPGNGGNAVARLRLDQVHTLRGASRLFDGVVLDADRDAVGSDNGQIIVLLNDARRDDLPAALRHAGRRAPRQVRVAGAAGRAGARGSPGIKRA